MAVAKKISIVCLVTRVCLTSAILVTKASMDPTNVPRQWHSYLPATNSPFPKHSNHQYDDHHAIGSNPERLTPSRDVQAERLVGLQSASTSSNRNQKSQAGLQSIRGFPLEIHQDDVWLSKVPNISPSPLPTPTPTTTTTTTTTTTRTLSGLQGIQEYHRHVPRFAYQDVEVLDEYLTDKLNDDRLPYLGKVKTAAYYRRGPQDITAAIKTLDLFLSRTLNDDGYNSKVHPPPNPVLALVLSRYGRYVPGPRNPRVYAYLAANNIHNHQPFGKYKYELDEEPIYVTRR